MTAECKYLCDYKHPVHSTPCTCAARRGGLLAPGLPPAPLRAPPAPPRRVLPRVRGRADVRRARGHEQQRDLVPGPGTRGQGHRGHVARDQLGAGLRPVSVPGNNIYCI